MIKISSDDIDQLEKESTQYFENELSFDEDRRTAIINFDDIQACPGSGKTTLLSAKLILMAKKWKNQYQGICVLSHTNVAKNEIISRLEKHPDGSKLLNYPHFIGTIQEFTNRFLSIPYMKYNHWALNQITDVNSLAEAYLKLPWRKYTLKKDRNKSYFLSYLHHRRQIPFNEILFVFNNDQLKINPQIIEKANNHIIVPKGFEKYLTDKRITLLNQGIITYMEMYEFAFAYLHQNPSISTALQARFPYVFIDEMQDTDAKQDQLINQAFRGEESKTIIQMFGDPDQAIFFGSKDSDPNRSFNQESDLTSITTSHRFTESIAKLISPMSLNQLTITSTLATDDSLPHTIFLVDDNTREKAIPAFAKLCLKHNLSTDKHPIKAVGSVGESQANLRIPHYFPQFEKNNNPDSFNPDKLFHFFIYAQNLKNESKHTHQSYKTLLAGINKLYQLNHLKISLDKQEKYPTIQRLKSWLSNNNKLNQFNLFFLKATQKELTKENWDSIRRELINIFELDYETIIQNIFLEFDSNYQHQIESENNNLNRYYYSENGQEIAIDIGTIHSIKGETHTATLVLETKYYQNDIAHVIDILLGIDSKKQIAAQKTQFMKRLYVAMSRPKHLLCLACDKSIFTEERINKINKKPTWNLMDLTQ